MEVNVSNNRDGRLELCRQRLVRRNRLESARSVSGREGSLNCETSAYSKERTRKQSHWDGEKDRFRGLKQSQAPSSRSVPKQNGSRSAAQSVMQDEEEQLGGCPRAS